MKIVKRIFKIIVAIILIPTVLLVAFILIADAKGMEFGKDGQEAVAEKNYEAVSCLEGFDFFSTENLIEY